MTRLESAETLAGRMRAKYPGSYDDLSDEDLEAKVLAKHPEYSDLPRSKPATAKLDASAFRRSDEIPSANPNPGAPGGPPSRASSLMVPLSIGYAPESLVGATSIGGLVRGSIGHLLSKEGMKELAKNVAIGAGLNMAAGRNPKEGIAEGILYTALGGPGAGNASRIERGAETASEFALKIPKYVAPVAKQAERVATWTPKQLGMELIEESAAKNGSSLAEIANGAAPKLKLSAAEVKKIMDRQAIPLEERVDSYLRKAGEPEAHLNRATRDARLAARRARGEANIAASRQISRPAPGIEPVQPPVSRTRMPSPEKLVETEKVVPKLIKPVGRTFEEKQVESFASDLASGQKVAGLRSKYMLPITISKVSEAKALLAERARSAISIASQTAAKLQPPKTDSELYMKLSQLYHSDKASRDAVLAAVKEAAGDQWQEVMLQIKRGNTRF